MPGTFGQMLAANPERAGELWKKLRVLQAGLAKTAGANAAYYIENPVISLLGQRSTAWDKAPGPEVLVELRGMLDAWQAPEGFPLPFVMLGEHIINALTASGREKDKDGKPGPVEIERVLQAMTEHLDERQGILVTSLLETVLFNLKAHEKPEVRAQLEKISASAPDSWAHRTLADALAQRMRSWVPSQAREEEAQAAEAARSKAKKEGRSAEEIAALPDPAVIRRHPIHQGLTDPAKLPAYQQKYAALAGDKNVNATIRAGVLIHASLQHDGTAEPDRKSVV